MLQRWTLSLNYMHDFFSSAHFSEWLPGSSPRELICALRVSACFFLRESTCACGQNCICMCKLYLLESQRAHAHSTRIWHWRVCVHACRMTFSETWQREGKHLTHNWSAMKEIWSWICIKLTCSALNQQQEQEQEQEAACLARTPDYLTTLKADYNPQNDTPQKMTEAKTQRIQGERSWWQNR